MITLFACPKPFRGHINTIQRNAIQSWKLLRPEPEIILIGNDEGVPEIAQEFNLIHIPKVERNDFGTPLLSSIFSNAERKAANDLLCFINADIILLDDFIRAIESVIQLQPSCLMVGQRWNLDIRKAISFCSNWENNLKDCAREHGKLEIPNAMDFFVFPKALFDHLPPFALGRTMYDNWLVSQARLQEIPVIDLTDMVTIIHQNHDYSHHCKGKMGITKGEEAKKNIELAKGFLFAFTIWDSDYKLTSKGIYRRSILCRFYGDLVDLSQRYPFLKPLARMIRLAREGIRLILHVFIAMI